jgi:peroxiredoxin
VPGSGAYGHREEARAVALVRSRDVADRVMIPGRVGAVLGGIALTAALGTHFVLVAQAQVEREQAGACLPLAPIVKSGSAPEFSLPDPTGKMVSLSSWRGKVVFLNFWLSSCKPCEEEMPGMERLRRQLQQRGVEMVAVTADESWDDVHRLLNRLFPGEPAGMVLLRDVDKKVATLYGTKLFPETYLIDRQGNLRYYFNNARDWGTREARHCVESLLE